MAAKKKQQQKAGKWDLKHKAGKFSIKSNASQAYDIRAWRAEEDRQADQDCARPRRSG